MEDKYEVCKECDGSGQIHSHNPKCYDCNGKGKVLKKKPPKSGLRDEEWGHLLDEDTDE